VALKERLKKTDAILFVTPEYNRSVLKNAIDMASRPYGHSAWDGKPGAIISVSTGAIGGFGANHHLRQSLVFLNMPTMTQPEAYIGGAANLVDDQGDLTVPSTKESLGAFLVAFDRWIDRNHPAR
jgi:chromate reductase, NAD(P)H dehydrogenase (quinone)